MTEQFKLGIHPPIRESGDIADTPGCTLEGPAGSVTLDRGVICALRHIHMTPDDALRYGVRDKSIVRVRVAGDRELIFGDVLVRVDPNFASPCTSTPTKPTPPTSRPARRATSTESRVRDIRAAKNSIQRINSTHRAPRKNEAAGRPTRQGNRAQSPSVRRLDATGKGHCTEHAALAGLLGKEPATVDPLFLDEMKAKPKQTYSVKLGDKTFNLSLADIIYDATKGDFPHANTMTSSGRDQPIYVQVGRRRLYGMEGLPAAEERPAEICLLDNKKRDCVLNTAERNNDLSIAQVIMANEVAVSGKTEKQIDAFLDEIANAMLTTVKSGLSVKEDVLPGTIKLHSKAATARERAQDEKYESDRADRDGCRLRTGCV